MNLGTATILGGGISAAGGLLGTGLSLMNQRSTRRWEENLANTAYQRQVADMRKAGLNPILAALKGGGADTPNVPPQTVNTDLSAFGEGVASAARLKHLDQKRMENETRLADVEVARRQQEIIVGQHTAERLIAAADLDRANTRLADANARIVGARTPEQEFYERLFRILNKWTDRGIQAAPGVVQLGREHIEEVKRVIRDAPANIKQSLIELLPDFAKKWFSDAPKYVPPSDQAAGGRPYGGSSTALQMLQDLHRQQGRKP